MSVNIENPTRKAKFRISFLYYQTNLLSDLFSENWTKRFDFLLLFFKISLSRKFAFCLTFGGPQIKRY